MREIHFHFMRNTNNNKNMISFCKSSRNSTHIMFHNVNIKLVESLTAYFN
jgi:hypothetical protein